MTDSWNQEGAFEEAVHDLADHIHFTEQERLDEAAQENEEFLAEIAEDEKEPDIVIEHGEHLSRIPGLRDRCHSLEDYIALISTEGASVNASYNSQDIDDEDILHDAIIEVCYKKLVGNIDTENWSNEQLNYNYIDTGHLHRSQEYPNYLGKMFKLLKSGGINAICDWLPSIAKYIENQRGTTNAEERQKYFDKWRASDEDLPF